MDAVVVNGPVTELLRPGAALIRTVVKGGRVVDGAGDSGLRG
jgi:hypothetical protein